MTYDNIKSNKKPGLHPPCRRYISGKTTKESQTDPHPTLPPSYLMVDFILFDTQLTLFFLINGQTLRMLFIRTDVLALKEVPIVKIILCHIPTSQ